WFSSRTIQAQLLETILPTRERLELAGSADGAPVVLSSIGSTLREIFFINRDGTYWRGESIHAGEKKTLQPASQHDFERWWSAQNADAGARIRSALNGAEKRAGYFYATSYDARGVAVETLSSIRWKQQRAIFLGPMQ